MNFKSLWLGSKTSLLTKLGTITINTFLPVRNKFVYSCSIKICALDLMNSWKAFSVSCWLWKHFPTKSCQDAWRHDSQLASGQVTMANEAKLHSSIHSTFEALVMWCALGCYHGEELGPFCWPMLATRIRVFGTSHQFAEHTFQM